MSQIMKIRFLIVASISLFLSALFFENAFFMVVGFVLMVIGEVITSLPHPPKTEKP